LTTRTTPADPAELAIAPSCGDEQPGTDTGNCDDGEGDKRTDAPAIVGRERELHLVWGHAFISCFSVPTPRNAGGPPVCVSGP
jgi:hypothetical protein